MCQVNDIKQKHLLGGNQKKKFRFASYLVEITFTLHVYMKMIKTLGILTT